MEAVKMSASEEPQPSPTIDEKDVIVGAETVEHQLEICRICLLESQDMRGLFHQDDDFPALSQKAMSLACVKMLPGDGLPCEICCNCVAKLESAYKFKVQVEQADSILREKLSTTSMKKEIFMNENEIHSQIHQKNEENCLLKEITKFENSEDKILVNNQELEDENNSQHIVEKVNQICLQQISEIDTNQCIETEIQNQETQLPGQQNQSFEPQQIQEMMLKEICDQAKTEEEINESEQLTTSEHNNVSESSITDNNDLKQIKQNTKNNIQKQSKKFEQDDLEKKSLNESFSETFEINLEQHEKDFDEENYFENLNLSSRLNKVKSENVEKVFFMCYLCDKQFLSKEVLKEHMHSHDEVKQTLNLSSISVEKMQKTPEKSQDADESSLKIPSSGKQLNKCPHCGKEYLYIISFNKHLKQHENDKNNTKDQSMPIEVSFQEDDDAIDFHDYKDVSITDSCSEDEIKKPITCTTCNLEFNTKKKLIEHQLQHISEQIFLNSEFQVDSKQPSINDQDNTMVPEESEQKIAEEDLKKESIKELKCPDCPMKFINKKNLLRHMESHNGKRYSCKFCTQSFSKKDHLSQHIEQHGNRHRFFKCVQCNKSFNNELTLRNHLIATNHKTTIHGEEYDPNRRIKRSAAKAAQKIIDQIKTDLNNGESEEEEEKSDNNDADFADSRHDHQDSERNLHTDVSFKKMQRSKTLTCETCSLNFSSKQALKKHLEKHAKDEEMCKQENYKTLEGNIDNDIGNHDDEDDDDNFEGGLGWPTETHECPTCQKKYSTKKSLLRHQLLHEEPNFECDICHVKFYRKDKLKAHYDKCSEKNPDQVRKCNICGDIFENNEILKEHRANHVMEGVLTEEDLRNIEPGAEDKNSERTPRKRRTDIVGLECHECNKEYTSRKGLLRHIQIHEGKKYLCDICPKKFFRQEHLKIHVAKHNITKPYKCSRCTKRFIKQEQLNNHLLKHERTFKKPKETDSVKRFLCEICSKSFTQSTTLIAHLRAHNGIKPYVCEVCSRPFTTNAYLKMHMRTHTQERPYICQYCSRAFARADTLANHLTSHTGEAKYHCKYCPKHFRRLKSLKEHVFIHTGQRPYACPTCDRKFNNNGSRYAHSKRCKQNLQTQVIVHHVTTEPNMEEIADQMMQEEPSQIQLQDQQLEIQTQLQQRISLPTTSQTQMVKPQNIKTITITRPDGGLNQQHIMATHQEILMPLLLPLTVTLTDVGEEVILPEGAKIFTA